MKRRDDPIAFLHSNYIPEPNSGCWLWLGLCNRRGYGVIGYQRKRSLAHRMMLSFYQPNSDANLYACHRCDVTSCINPDHLFWGTQGQNLQDAVSKGRMKGYPRAAGAQHGMARLTEAQVSAIRASDASSKDLGNQYSISPAHVWRIRTGKIWRQRV